MKNIFFLLLLLIFFFGCAAQSEKIILVLDWTVNTNHTGLYVAKDKGYFTDQGLDVAIEVPPETGGSSLLLSGRAQFSISYQEEVTYARAKDRPMKALAAIIQHNTSGFASRKKRGITSFKDFEGKSYGGWGMPVEEAVLKALMNKSGGDYNRIQVIPIGSMDFFAATEQDIDFVWIFEAWDGVAAGIKNIDINYLPLKDIDPALDYYTPVIASTDEYVKKNPQKVKAFMKAVAKGYDFAISNPEEAAEILLKNAPELNRELVIKSQKYLSDKYRSDAAKWGVMKLDVWESFAQWLKSYKLLEGDFKAQEAYTNDFLP